MTNTTPTHVVLGASGGAGAAIVRALEKRGEHVRAVTRTGQPASGMEVAATTEWVAADARDLSQLQPVYRDAAVIYHAVNVPYPEWPAILPPVMEAAIAAAEDSGARLVYVDNLYLYGPVAGPMREDLPAAATTKKGRLRARLAAQLLHAHESGRIQATIGRSSDYFGPGVTGSAAGADLFRSILAGAAVRWFGKLDEPHSLTFIDDAAAAFVVLGEDARALGQAWHLPAAAPLTGRQFITLAGELAGASPRPQGSPALIIRAMGLINPMAREFSELSYQFDRPFVVDTSKYTATFGGAPTALREALARSVAWYREHQG